MQPIGEQVGKQSDVQYLMNKIICWGGSSVCRALTSGGFLFQALVQTKLVVGGRCQGNFQGTAKVFLSRVLNT